MTHSTKGSQIRHRRLKAFYESKVLNSLMMVIVVCLFIIKYTQSLLLPTICAAIATCSFIGYSLWLWIKKPKRIVVDKWLSDINGTMILYFLIVNAIKDANEWWYIFPIICAVIAYVTSLLKPQDEIFEIG